VDSLTDQQLLRDYAEGRSEKAFAELVRRHVDLVYSAAVRMVCDAHLAEDVTQRAFLALARNARQLAERPVLSGWLHRTAQNLAANTVRSDVRRRAREQEAAAMNELLAREPDAAWEDIAPHLDAALGELSEVDRDALLLRYFQRQSAREMAQALGLSEEAAQKRVSRAVERLRECFAKRGLAVGASGLMVVISANAVQAAPGGLAAAISTAAAVTGTTAASVLTATATKAIAMTALQKTVVAATLAAALASSVFIQLRHRSSMREADQALRPQAGQLARLQAENQRLSNLAAQASSPNQLDDLQKLRAEAAGLRGQTKELAALEEEKDRLRTQNLPQAGRSKTALEIKEEGMAKLNYSRDWMLAFLEFADRNQGQFPTNLSQAAAFLPDSRKEEAAAISDQLEIVYHGLRDALTNPANVVVLRERQAWQFSNGNWNRVYVFADGHSEIHAAPDGDFAGWEQERIVAPPTL
jgi:RNA polymerase sigma factor (sigma-70 family)